MRCSLVNSTFYFSSGISLVGKKNGPQEQWNAWGNKKSSPWKRCRNPATTTTNRFLILWFEHTNNSFYFLACAFHACPVLYGGFAEMKT